jgi:hypothetical protein
MAHGYEYGSNRLPAEMPMYFNLIFTLCNVANLWIVFLGNNLCLIYTMHIPYIDIADRNMVRKSHKGTNELHQNLAVLV